MKDLLADASLLDQLQVGEERCCYCEVPLQKTITGKRRAPEGNACSDCYYAELGNGIEEYPIAAGRIRRS